MGWIRDFFFYFGRKDLGNSDGGFFCMLLFLCDWRISEVVMFEDVMEVNNIYLFCMLFFLSYLKY